MPKDDGVRLRHMVDAARDAMSFASGRRRADLDDDRQLAAALIRCLEVVGEAAAHVTQSRRDHHPTIPWRNVVAMRNQLIHAYADVDLDIVWDTVQVDLPALVAELEVGDADDKL